MLLYHVIFMSSFKEFTDRLIKRYFHDARVTRELSPGVTTTRSSRDVLPRSCRTADGGGLCCWNGEQACSSLQIRSRKICFVNPSLFKEEFLITTQQRTPLVLALISDSRIKPGFLSLFHPAVRKKKKTPNTQKCSSSMFLCLRSVFCSFLPWGQQKLHFFFFFFF